jgi:hypothetical protein
VTRDITGGLTRVEAAIDLLSRLAVATSGSSKLGVRYSERIRGPRQKDKGKAIANTLVNAPYAQESGDEEMEEDGE